MSRRLTALVLGSAISMAPAVSFAFNATALAGAKTCCDGMEDSCSGQKTPRECCGTQLVAIEASIELAKIVLHLDLPATEAAAQSIDYQPLHTAALSASPPPVPSPPLVLRI